MAINDPVGDMLTRIRNAQMRRRGNVTTPGSRLRGRVLDVLKSEGFIRDYSTTEFGNGRTEFNIELKYFDGQPVIRSVQRVSKPGRRVYASVDETERLIARLKMAELPRNGNPTRIRNRCELTGRSRGYYRKFRLSRIMLRELANKGLIPGVVKSSW